jgi:ribosomal protein S18 acetylase RimI-like enzyme
MHIRKAKTSDLAAIERTIRRLKELRMPPGYALPLSYNRTLLKEGIALVAEFDGHFAGFLLAEADRRTSFSYVTYLAVLPAYHGLGLGSTLLDAHRKACRKLGIRLVMLHAYAWNKKASMFYAKRGFRAGGPQIPFYKKLR